MTFPTSLGAPASAARIAWHEGLQLLPQHFQLADERVDAIVGRLAMTGQLHAWGIDHISLDPSALAGGTLRVLEVSGSFPDGSVFSWTQSQYGLLERRLDASDDAGVQRYALAWPIADFRDRETNVARHRQYIGEPVADLLDADNKAAISRLIPNLSLRRFDRHDSRYLQIPFALIEMGRGGPRLHDFDPASTRLRSNGLIHQTLVGLVRVLREKAAELGSDPHARTLSGLFSGPTVPVLQSLLGPLPRLEALLHARSHPHELFLAVCDLSGALAWMQPNALPSTPQYDHFDPAAAIVELANQCVLCVQGIVLSTSAKWRAHSLRRQDGRWIGKMPEATAETLILRVQLSTHEARADAIAWLDRALICSEDEEFRCRNLRVRGFHRELVERVDELGESASSSQLLLKVKPSSVKEIPWSMVVGLPEELRDSRISAIDYLEPH